MLVESISNAGMHENFGTVPPAEKLGEAGMLEGQLERVENSWGSGSLFYYLVSPGVSKGKERLKLFEHVWRPIDG